MKPGTHHAAVGVCSCLLLALAVAPVRADAVFNFGNTDLPEDLICDDGVQVIGGGFDLGVLADAEGLLINWKLAEAFLSGRPLTFDDPDSEFASSDTLTGDPADRTILCRVRLTTTQLDLASIGTGRASLSAHMRFIAALQMSETGANRLSLDGILTVNERSLLAASSGRSTVTR